MTIKQRLFVGKYSRIKHLPTVFGWHDHMVLTVVHTMCLLPESHPLILPEDAGIHYCPGLTPREIRLLNYNLLTVENLNKQYEITKKRLSKLIDSHIDDKIPQDLFDQKKDELLKEKAEIEVQLASNQIAHDSSFEHPNT